MTPTLVLIIAIVILIGLIAAEVPVAYALLSSGAVGLILLRDLGYTFSTLANTPFAVSGKFTLILIPMFVIMGMLVVQAGIADDVYAFAARVLGRFPAGLGYATVAACAGFAAVTGSSAATVATIGRISINEMRKHGYSVAFASGIVGASGTLGILIPPSLVLVIYGTLSGESIGLLLIAGIVPGVLSALLYTLVVAWRAKTDVGPQFVLEQAADAEADAVVAQASRGYASVFKVALLFLIVVGGIYTGVVTATESGALAAFAALLMLIYTGFRRRDLPLLRLMRDAFNETTAVSTMIFMLLIGGGVFTFFMASGGYARSFTLWVTELPVPGYLIVVLFLLAMIPLGMFLDGLSILLITIPLIHPIVTELGFDGIWFAILVVKTIELGLITPPVGINVYVVAGAAPGLKVEDVFKGIWPFGVMDVLTISLLFAFPFLVTWLPSLAP